MLAFGAQMAVRLARWGVRLIAPHIPRATIGLRCDGAGFCRRRQGAGAFRSPTVTMIAASDWAGLADSVPSRARQRATPQSWSR